MKRRIMLIAAFVSLAFAGASADDKPLFAPRPTKDAMALKKHSHGIGVFEMNIDTSSGKVKQVFVRSSTNDLFLDAAAINTFLQWRFKPRTVAVLRLPVAFGADSDTAFYPIKITTHTANRGLPAPFRDPVTAAKLWQLFPEAYGGLAH